MAVLAIKDGDCESVRKAIDIRLDAVTLPNTTILLDIYAGVAVNRVLARMGDKYEEANQNDKLLPAAIFACASLLIPAIKQINLERLAGQEKRFTAMDWDKKIAELNGRVEEIIDQILDAGKDGTAAMPSHFFTTAKVRRRGYCGF